MRRLRNALPDANRKTRKAIQRLCRAGVIAFDPGVYITKITLAPAAGITQLKIHGQSIPRANFTLFQGSVFYADGQYLGQVTDCKITYRPRQQW